MRTAGTLGGAVTALLPFQHLLDALSYLAEAGDAKVLHRFGDMLGAIFRFALRGAPAAALLLMLAKFLQSMAKLIPLLRIRAGAAMLTELLGHLAIVIALRVGIARPLLRRGRAGAGRGAGRRGWWGSSGSLGAGAEARGEGENGYEEAGFHESIETRLVHLVASNDA